MKNKQYSFIDVLLVIVIVLAVAAILIDSVSIRIHVQTEQPTIKEKTSLII